MKDNLMIISTIALMAQSAFAFNCTVTLFEEIRNTQSTTLIEAASTVGEGPSYTTKMGSFSVIVEKKDNKFVGSMVDGTTGNKVSFENNSGGELGSLSSPSFFGNNPGRVTVTCQ